MRFDSARSLKTELLKDVVLPFAAAATRIRAVGARAVADAMARGGLTGDASLLAVGARPAESLPIVQRSIALGIAPRGREFRLAVRVQRPALGTSDLFDEIRRRARGEVDVRLVGRVDKRARTQRAARRAPVVAVPAQIPWYQGSVRPLLIGASIGHVNVTAGTLGCFVLRGRTPSILSNNHVLANENRGRRGDDILQPGSFDGGSEPADRVGGLGAFVRLSLSGANVVDAALATIDQEIEFDETRLRGLVGGRDRRLAGVAPEEIETGETVHKVGRTTGATRGRVTAFALDNLVVNYDLGNLRFDDQIEIEGTGTRPFSDGGDSGSLIVNAEMQALALLFAGSESGGRNNLGLTFANPIHRVLESLRVTLAT